MVTFFMIHIDVCFYPQAFKNAKHHFYGVSLVFQDTIQQILEQKYFECYLA